MTIFKVAKNNRAAVNNEEDFIMSTFKFFSRFTLAGLLIVSQVASAARLSVLYGGGSGGSNKNYVRVFVTSTTYDGNLGGIAGADAKCQARADAASLGGTWKAMISDGSTNASSRILNRTKPVFTISGKLAWNPSQQVILGGDTNPANGYGSLPFGGAGIVGSAINITELGTAPAAYVVWAATNTNGLVQGTSHCSNWTSNSSGISGYYGNASATNATWISQNVSPCNNSYRLYCLEDE
jgi:hypothetical protein